jgi:hypothetical protein
MITVSNPTFSPFRKWEVINSHSIERSDSHIDNRIIVYFLGRHSREGGNPIYPRMDARLRTSGMTDKE